MGRCRFIAPLAQLPHGFAMRTMVAKPLHSLSVAPEGERPKGVGTISKQHQAQQIVGTQRLKQRRHHPNQKVGIEAPRPQPEARE